MPLSAEEQKTLAALQAKADEPASVDLWVRDDKSGKSLLVGGDYARKLLREFGLEADDAGGDGKGGKGGDDGKGGDGAAGEPPPPAAHRFFK